MREWPTSFAETMKAKLGPEWEAFAAAHQEPPPVSIRLNPRKHALISTQGQVPWSQYGRYLQRRPSFTFDPTFHAGTYYVQEASSMFLEQAFLQIGGSADNLTILDLCAAPGGKSTHLLSLMSSSSMLVSNEVIGARASILSENIQKWGQNNVVVTSSDPQQFSSLQSVFDIAVVDAPCSGEGLFRKDPDAMDSWSPENVVLCSRRQRRILEDVWPAIKRDGYLIYATCTYNEQENEENLSWLLGREDAEGVTINIRPEWNVTAVDRPGLQGYRFFPHKVQGEGFFMAVIRKTSGSLNTGMKISAELPRIATPVQDEITKWIDAPVRFFAHKDELRAVPLRSEKLLNILTKHLYIVNAGTLIGTAKHNKIVPAHAAALSVNLNQSLWPTLDADEETAIRYLRKEPIDTTGMQRGFTLVRYQGLGLGWINVLDTRANNLYPAEWRIRAQSRDEEGKTEN
ncbi:rRNA methyltransferase [Chryseolinea sp. T2]|uniref:methyltransferase RsmF C-terminal domain-like protein n=1 Tax=Chryseolinea sp. T2 TaxID=3129255 RepID=UPI003077D0C6